MDIIEKYEQYLYERGKNRGSKHIAGEYADKFHIIRLVNYALDFTRRVIQPQAPQRIIEADLWVKG